MTYVASGHREFGVLWFNSNFFILSVEDFYLHITFYLYSGVLRHLFLVNNNLSFSMVLNTGNCVLKNTDFGPGGKNKRTKSYSCRRNERKGKLLFHFSCLMQVLEFEI